MYLCVCVCDSSHQLHSKFALFPFPQCPSPVSWWMYSPCLVNCDCWSMEVWLTGNWLIGAGIAQPTVCWVRCSARCSIAVSTLLWASGRGDFFPLELPWVLTPFPEIRFDESINQGIVCAHMYSVTQTQKILTFMSWTGECRQQKHTHHAPFTKTECDYL